MRLRIALPVGRMENWAIGTLQRASIPVRFFDRRYRIWKKHELVAQILWAKPKEIPRLVSNKVVDAGLTGSDCCEEWVAAQQKQRSQLQNFHFLPIRPEEHNKKAFPHLPTAKLCLIAKGGQKVGSEVFSPKGLRGKGCEIVTDFPSIVQLRFQRAKVIPFSGGIEGLVPEPYKYGVTLVETGKSLRNNELALSEVLQNVCPAVCFCKMTDKLKRFVGLINRFGLY